MTLSGIIVPFGTLFRSPRYVTYPLRTLSPLTGLLIAQKTSPFDLHVLATPPAFVLSQDQTLQFDSSNPPMFSYENKTGGMVVLFIPLCFLAKTRQGGWLNTFIGTHIESAEKTHFRCCLA